MDPEQKRQHKTQRLLRVAKSDQVARGACSPGSRFYVYARRGCRIMPSHHELKQGPQAADFSAVLPTSSIATF